MKVICQCCHRGFDYDMYMGLCPKCGRVYRREKGVYSAVERDMVGDFHLHADEGGLNRGIHGVVYNQGSTSPKKILNRASKATVNTEVDSFDEANPTPIFNVAQPVQSAQAMVSQTANQVNQIRNGQAYYGAYHKTRMNQGVKNKNNKSGSALAIIIFIFIIFGLIAGIFD